uniref:Uncharacterized protein n=1 Tax=Aceria tosichella TaxID=561515 RepID=A0A6G1SBB0_9ACAR
MRLSSSSPASQCLGRRLILVLPLLIVLFACLLGLATKPIEAAASSRKSKCPQARELQLDDHAARLGFLGDHSFRVPQNLTRMGAFCGQLKESVGGIQSYARDCLQGFTRQILTTIMKRGKQQQSSICQSDSSKQDFMQRFSCLRGERIAAFHGCMDASVARYEFIAKEVPTENKLPSLCCSYQIFYQDMDDTLAQLCGNGRKDSETSKFVQKFVTGTTGEFLRLVCDDHRSMDDCRSSKKTSESLKQLQEITKKVKQGKLAPQGKSLIPPLLEILDASS